MVNQTGSESNGGRGWYLRIDINPDGHDILQFQRNGGGMNWFIEDGAAASQRSSNVPFGVNAPAGTEHYTNLGPRSELLGRELRPSRQPTNASTNAGPLQEDIEAAEALSSLGQSSLPKPASTVHSLMFDRALLVTGKSATKASTKALKQVRGIKASVQPSLETSSAQAADLRSGQSSLLTGETQRSGWYYKPITPEEESPYTGAFRTSLTDEHARVTRSVLRQTKANETPVGIFQPSKSTPVKRGHGERASSTVNKARLVVSSPDPEDRASNPRVGPGNPQSHNKAKLGPARLFPKLRLRFTGEKVQAEKSAEDHVDNGEGQAAEEDVTVSRDKAGAEEQYGERSEDENLASDFGDEELAGMPDRGEDSWTRARDDGRDLDGNDGDPDRIDEGEDHTGDDNQPQRESDTQHSGLASLMLQRHRAK